MKKIKLPRLPDRIAVTAGLLLLLAGGVMAVLGFGGKTSEWENRNLAAAPGTVSMEKWTTDKETEEYLKDHVPLRQALVAVDSSVQQLTGRGSTLNDWYVAGAMVQRPVEADDYALTLLERRLSRLGRLADRAGVPWAVLSPETHGYLIRDRMNPMTASLYDREADAMALVEATGHRVAMPEVFTENPDTMYYRTDHHWTAEGAYQAYAALGEALGYEPVPMEDFRVTEYPGFMGTTLSGTGLPPFWSDTLVCAEPDSPVKLTVIDNGEETVFDRLIFPENAKTKDGYAVYLNGNHGKVIIERESAPEGTLIVYRDSFASCLLPMLSRHFRRIIAVDARYDSGVFSDALRMSDDTRAILYLYSLDSLVTDTEITKKAK